MNTENQKEPVAYISVSIISSAIYILYTLFIWGMTNAYPSSSTGYFYYLIVFLPFMPFVQRKGYRKVKSNEAFGWLYGVSPAIWYVFATLLSMTYIALFR